MDNSCEMYTVWSVYSISVHSVCGHTLANDGTLLTSPGLPLPPCYVIRTFPVLLLRIRGKNSTDCAGNSYSSVSSYVVTVDNPQVTCEDAEFPSSCRIRIEELFTLFL